MTETTGEPVHQSLSVLTAHCITMHFYIGSTFTAGSPDTFMRTASFPPCLKRGCSLRYAYSESAMPQDSLYY